MKIDGRAIADAILDELKTPAAALGKLDRQPTLVVILIGDDPGSLSYIRQKQKAAETVGIRLIFEHLDANPVQLPVTLTSLIDKYNSDPAVHALIIQRPVPGLNPTEMGLLQTIKPGKDVDGFVPVSKFIVPVAAAVWKILDQIYKPAQLSQLLQTKTVVVIGRGDTAGKPISEYLSRYCTTSVINSQTPNPNRITATADIIISCVGKPDILGPHNIKPGATLISVGLSRGTNGKLVGDYDQEKISGIAGFYTPTPGGVGPVNVACLMANVIQAASIPDS